MKQELEVYIHIPFCIKKCHYCDFLSFSVDAEDMDKYVDALLKQIETQKVVAKEYEVTTIFIGGGTPSLLKEEQIQQIFYKLYEVFQIVEDAEITIEVNPGTSNQEKMKLYRKIGINRLSIGLQSTNEEELKTLGRIHTYDEFLITYQQARDAGFQNINIDLMSAIPGQQVLSWKANLEKVICLQPEHISSYSLIIEEGTLFYDWYEDEKETNKLPKLPSEEEILQIDEITKAYLKEQGYEQYEISNYAKQGYACKHNLGYWDRKEYIGLGLGASSYVKGRRYKNVTNRKRYLDNPQEIEEECILTLQEQKEEFCFLGLRKIEGISSEEFEKQFGISLEEEYGKEIKKLQNQGLLERKEEQIFLTERGLELGNYVFEKFIRSLECEREQK